MWTAPAALHVKVPLVGEHVPSCLQGLVLHQARVVGARAAKDALSRVPVGEGATKRDGKWGRNCTNLSIARIRLERFGTTAAAQACRFPSAPSHPTSCSQVKASRRLAVADYHPLRAINKPHERNEFSLRDLANFSADAVRETIAEH
eukprot:6204817-Pleurochrysis_carterae.AAC.2